MRRQRSEKWINSTRGSKPLERALRDDFSEPTNISLMLWRPKDYSKTARHKAVGEYTLEE